MAVVNVMKGWSQSTGEQQVPPGRDVVVEPYTVLTDNPADDQTVVEQAAGLPVMNESHPSSAFLRVKRRRFDRVGPTLWSVLIEYERLSIQPGAIPDPLQAPPIVTWDGVFSVVATDTALDQDNMPTIRIANSAGASYEGGAPVEVADGVLRVQRNKPTFDYAQAMAYRGAVNSDFFFSEPGQARLMAIRGEFVNEGQFSYWVVNYEVHFRRGYPLVEGKGSQPSHGGPLRAWWVRVRDEGRWYRDENGFPQPFNVDRWDLDGNGKPLAPENTPPSQMPPPVYLEFQVYPMLPFQPLGIL